MSDGFETNRSEPVRLTPLDVTAIEHTLRPQVEAWKAKPLAELGDGEKLMMARGQDLLRRLGHLRASWSLDRESAAELVKVNQGVGA